MSSTSCVQPLSSYLDSGFLSAEAEKYVEILLKKLIKLLKKRLGKLKRWMLASCAKKAHVLLKIAYSEFVDLLSKMPVADAAIDFSHNKVKFSFIFFQCILPADIQP
ncbi:hypothetical protein V9T40_000173 [Parthenolecanium corni]|uniref:Uncharacterized protein n=1 Tax=Parthenolecanium corni TaxID=536013 RepID=A0AAN9Y351_9HEMI